MLILDLPKKKIKSYLRYLLRMSMSLYNHTRQMLLGANLNKGRNNAASYGKTTTVSIILHILKKYIGLKRT